LSPNTANIVFVNVAVSALTSISQQPVSSLPQSFIPNLATVIFYGNTFSFK